MSTQTDYTVSELASLFGVSRQAIANQVRRWNLGRVRGRTWLLSADEYKKLREIRKRNKRYHLTTS